MNGKYLYTVLENALQKASENVEGHAAEYIPELCNVDPELTSVSMCLNGEFFACGDIEHKFTLQSVSKLVLLIGMLEEFGAENVFSWIKAEPSGQPFASIGYLASNGPTPSNPLINSGAICLSSMIPGNANSKILWIEKWINQLFGAELEFSESVYNSELQTADSNRALAYLMKSTGIIKGDVEAILRPYFSLCSYKANIAEVVYLPMLLASSGISPEGHRIISEETCNIVISLMATCGLYNESGMHLVKCGLPAKSAVSGLIVATSVGRCGIAAFNPRINSYGTGIRAQIIINEISKNMNLHFASSGTAAAASDLGTLLNALQ